MLILKVKLYLIKKNYASNSLLTQLCDNSNSLLTHKTLLFLNKSNNIINVVVGLTKTLFHLFNFDNEVYLLHNMIPHFVVHGSQHGNKKCSTCSHYNKKSDYEKTFEPFRLIWPKKKVFFI